jgi:hypothetical protein
LHIYINMIQLLSTKKGVKKMLNEKYYWKCGTCHTSYAYGGGEKYIVSTDFSSFEADISIYQCKTNCQDIWEMG